MKTAVYLANLTGDTERFDAARAAKDLGLLPEDTVFCAGREPFEDLETAIQRWLSEGEPEVFSIHATLADDGSVLPFGEPLRVVGHP